MCRFPLVKVAKSVDTWGLGRCVGLVQFIEYLPSVHKVLSYLHPQHHVKPGVVYAYNTIIWEVGQKFKVIGSVTCLGPAWAKLDHVSEKKLFFLQVLSTYLQSQHFRLRHEDEEFEASLFYAFIPQRNWFSLTYRPQSLRILVVCRFGSFLVLLRQQLAFNKSQHLSPPSSFLIFHSGSIMKMMPLNGKGNRM